MQKNSKFGRYEYLALAKKRFSVDNLLKCLHVIGGVVLYDKEKDVDPNEANLFFIILDKEYKWNFCNNYCDTTVYFDTDGINLFAGAFNKNIFSKMTKIIIPPSRFSNYTYYESAIKVINSIK